MHDLCYETLHQISAHMRSGDSFHRKAHSYYYINLHCKENAHQDRFLFIMLYPETWPSYRNCHYAQKVYRMLLIAIISSLYTYFNDKIQVT